MLLGKPTRGWPDRWIFGEHQARQNGSEAQRDQCLLVMARVTSVDDELAARESPPIMVARVAAGRRLCRADIEAA